MASVLERGRARFFVRPRVMLPVARTFADVQRFFVLMAPEGRELVRRIAIGRKRMPLAGRREKEWAYVDRIGESFEDLLEDVAGGGYETKTEGWRVQAGPSEVARGTYLIRPHDDHVHLDYALEDEPTMAGLGLEQRGSIITAVFNPEAKWRRRHPERERRDGEEGPTEPSIYDEELQAKFGDKRFAPLEPGFMDCEGCELVLIGQSSGHEDGIDDEDGDRPEESPRLRSGHRRAGA